MIKSHETGAWETGYLFVVVPDTYERIVVADPYRLVAQHLNV